MATMIGGSGDMAAAKEEHDNERGEAMERIRRALRRKAEVDVRDLAQWVAWMADYANLWPDEKRALQAAAVVLLQHAADNDEWAVKPPGSYEQQTRAQRCENGHACRCEFTKSLQLSGHCCVHGEVECGETSSMPVRTAPLVDCHHCGRPVVEFGPVWGVDSPGAAGESADSAATAEEHWDQVQLEEALASLDDFISDARMGNPLGGEQAEADLGLIRAALRDPGRTP